jgi:hypothetical protein
MGESEIPLSEDGASFFQFKRRRGAPKSGRPLTVAAVPVIDKTATSSIKYGLEE